MKLRCPSPTSFARLSAGVGSVIALVIAVLATMNKIEAEQAGTAAIALFVAIALLALAVISEEVLKGAFSRVKSVSMGSLGIELEPWVRLADARHDETDVPDRDTTDGFSNSLVDLKIRLEAKLTFLAKHVFSTGDSSNNQVPTFLTVGSLSYDGMITRDQAKRAYEILGMRAYEFQQLPPAEQTVFLDGANQFVDTVRAEAFAGSVAKELRARGWGVDRLTSRPARRDLIVTDRAGSVVHHVVPVFAYGTRSALVDAARARLANSSESSTDGRRLIVVPPRSDAITAPADPPERIANRIEVVDVLGMLACLGAPGEK